MADINRIVIASRASRLALWQAEHVRAQILKLYPECNVSIDAMTTRGDQILDRALSKIGGKGLFVKELELAIAEGRCDLAVHSLKDVPMQMPEGFMIAAIGEREDALDALVSNEFASLHALPDGAVVGTSSLRRESQLRARFPHLRVAPLRGNLDTRLAKLDSGEFQAIILAAAGLKRLGLGARIRARIDPEDSLPAPGQGALGIEIRADRQDLAELLAPLNDDASALCVMAERDLAQRLGGSCEVPLGAYATIAASGEGALANAASITLSGFVGRPDGSALVRTRQTVTVDRAHAVGRLAADDLIAHGALALLS